jgi:hypothetical protein
LDSSQYLAGGANLLEDSGRKFAAALLESHQ